MFLRDLLVASVAIGLGLSMIQVSIVNQGWWFQNFIVKNIEASRGRGAARKALWFGGTAMILIGSWTVASPWLKKMESKSPPPSVGKVLQQDS